MSDQNFQPVTLLPMDEYNTQLIERVHPNNWVNPEPAECYDIVVIGAGTAGLVVAAGAAGLGIGLKVALVEKYLMGGDCLNLGCVPSKSIIRSARLIGEIAEAQNLGIRINGNIDIDFPAIMARMRRIRASISHHDSATRFKNIGVDIFLGNGYFLNKNSLEVGDKKLRFKKAVIATGARASKPEIKGLDEAGYLTNETVFSLTEKPRRLAVIGGGPIGCELAQVFQRLGTEVTLFHRGYHILNKEDIEAVEVIENRFKDEGIRLVLGYKLDRVVKNINGKTIYFAGNSETDAITVDEILVGVGRVPNVDGLNLEAAGVEYDQKMGVKVNDYLQTTNPKIYAAGDICMDWKFTHAADAAARIVIKNALFSPWGFGKAKLTNLVMPRVTYTHPEIAHVGMSEQEAQARGVNINTIKISFENVDRAITDGETNGFIKILHEQGNDRILGATIVANHAGEMISEITTAMVNNIGLSKLANVIHPYPTQAEAIKKVADAYRRTLLTPNTRRFLEFLTKFS